MIETGHSAGDAPEWYNPPCYHCALYHLWGRCAAHPKQIPYAFLVGDKECAKYREKPQR